MKRGSRKHDAEREFLMSLMAWIDYSSIVFFFVVAGMLIIAIGRPRQQNKAMAGADKQHACTRGEGDDLHRISCPLPIPCLSWVATINIPVPDRFLLHYGIALKHGKQK